MKTQTKLLRYTLFTLRLDMLWLPAAFWGLFLIISAIFRGHVNHNEISAAFLGFVLPLVGGILATSVVLDTPALELHFSTSHSAARVLLQRQGLLLAILAFLALSYQGIVALMDVDLSYLGSLLIRQLAWLTPTLALMSLGCFGALALRKSQNGMLLVGLTWIMQVLARDWFMFYPATRLYFAFMSIYRPRAPRPASQPVLPVRSGCVDVHPLLGAAAKTGKVHMILRFTPYSHHQIKSLSSACHCDEAESRRGDLKSSSEIASVAAEKCYSFTMI